MSTPHIFISHATEDDEFVATLREALEHYGLPVWVDSRNLRGGDIVNADIRAAIEQAGYMLVVLSLRAINSTWVPQEIEAAQKAGIRIVPLLLDGVQPAALRLWFQETPLAVAVHGADGLTGAMPELLAALGERLPTDAEQDVAIERAPVEDLTLELSDPTIIQQDGTRRTSATARLTYTPSNGAPPVVSRRFRFTSPLGPIEKEDVRWYLEHYFQWATGVFKVRAQKVEQQLKVWGQALHDAALNTDAARKALQGWQQAPADSDRRFCVMVEAEPLEGATDEEQAECREAATLLLGLPWELLHTGKAYLFKGGKGARVLRRLPNRESKPVIATDPPVRILLLSPRPEDQGTSYLDHRASARPLVDAIAELGDLATLTVLTPPTFPALEAELLRAEDAGRPYHVVHFDGHGVFDPRVGLGGLCFEHPEDSAKLAERRPVIITSDKLAEMLTDRRIALVFLDACQTAQADIDPTASVAAAMLERGVASVIAMSHSVLVATSRRFGERFYRALAAGDRVGKAVLRGQQELYNNSFRGRMMGAGDLHLHDWFVPVLFQEDHDPQLIHALPSATAQQLQQRQRTMRLGDLPDPPPQAFIGRSRELLAIERLLAQRNYAVLLGEGGEGKTTIAVEAARWLVATERFRKAAFVCVEDHADARTILDALGRQLVPNYSVAHYSGDLLKDALHPVERALNDHPTIIVIDNMESILGAPIGAPASLPANSLYEPEILAEVLHLCRKLIEVPGTKLIFTSREALPAPFGSVAGATVNITPGRIGGGVVRIGRLPKSEAIELVGRVMTAKGLTPPAGDAGETPDEIENLVEAVNGHARSLTLLAPEISRLGVTATTRDLHRLMADLHARCPDSREQSLFASIELSLRRLSPDTREKIKVLGVFQGGVSLVVLARILQIEADDVRTLAAELLDTGLAEEMGHGHLRLHPALCPYLLDELTDTERQQATQAWTAGMAALTEYLYKEWFQDAQLAAGLTLLELPNLLVMLDQLRQSATAETVVNYATRLESLLQHLGRPAALARVVAVREAAAAQLGEWSNALFEAETNSIDRMWQQGQLQQALNAAQELLQRCLDAGEMAYAGADYDIARAYFKLGRMLERGGLSQHALPPLAEAQSRFQAIADAGRAGVARMASVAITERGDCLCNLGRLDEAAGAYQEAIQRAETLNDFRQVAVGKGQLGTVRKNQQRYAEALEAYAAARDIFERLGEPGTVAVSWHQTGMVHKRAGNFEAAEAAYRKSLAIKVQQKNPQGEAASLTELGNLYDDMGRLEEAVAFYRQAADIDVRLGDLANEGKDRNNIADTLIKLQRFDEARPELQRAIECKQSFGHAAEPWTTWDILHDLEQAVGNPAAASAARDKAIAAYLAYRRDGGENHTTVGKLCAFTVAAIQQNRHAEAEEEIESYLGAEDIRPGFKIVLLALQAILRGSRDAALAEDPALEYADVVELRLLLEGLG